MNGDSANKFISALVKSLQTLCHGYVEFNDGIEIIGHLYLNIDSGASFDYVVKEKVCKNAENSTVFVSKSFQAQAPAEECITRKDKDDEAVPVFEESSEMSPTTGTSRLQSAITSISNVLSGSQHDVHKSRMLDHSSHHSPVQNNGKRKREHNGSYSGLQPPYKYTTLQATPSTYFNTPSSSTKQVVDRNHSSEHFNNSSHAEFFGGDSNQSSGMGREDEDDLDLDVTFVKEEYESQRNSGQRGVSAGGASRLSQDPSSNQSNILHDGGTLGYQSTNHHQAPQQFASGTAVELGTSSQNFTDPSQVDLSQHSSQSSQNPRNDATAGSPPRMPDGVKPLCGYVHPDDARKWMMFELVPGSSVYIHQENYNLALSKTRHERPDGKAMARYLMSCFWRQSDLVGASIAEPPKPYQKSLDRGIINAILRFCQNHSKELATDIRRTIQQKIGYAKFYFVKKTQDHDTPLCSPMAVEASPRRMSMEMARRGVDGMALDIQPKASKKGRKPSSFLRRMSECEDLSLRVSSRGATHKTGFNVSSQLSDQLNSGSMLSERLAADIADSEDVARCVSAEKHAASYSGHITGRMSPSCTSHHLPSDQSARSSIRPLAERGQADIPGRSSLNPLEPMSVRVLDSSLSDLPQRGGTVTPGMSRGFLDMFTTMYSTN
uniref:BEN domain-containing protein n=1 Tax=Biomphalaria glabrata TaxID=6526 RepID=A0A2C9LI69_BIOGL